ncbi:MAG: 30S ribosomal protein S19 [Legionellales bacterium]|jgi:small subunit ribosomal protein S19|nr:30S ribosomal protein S19 [Legionellales bacterium]|tara:strand:- start:703 stop:972 length:270 start_codon:yes stop_codon:yes gene_type:complete
MPRSLKKGPHVSGRLLQKVLKAQDAGSQAPIKTRDRNCTIIPDFVGMKFLVHNGRNYVPVFVQTEMVGHKFGMYALTRLFKQHAGDRKS